MSTTNVYAAKKALFDRLKERAATGQLLRGVDVAYAYRGDLGTEAIYGGGVRFDHEDAVAEHPGVMVTEDARISLYVRVILKPAGDVEDADLRAAEILGAIGAELRADARLAGGMTWLGITSGFGDYEQTDDATSSILACQVLVGSHLAYGG